MARHAIGRAEHRRAEHDIDREVQIRLPTEPTMHAEMLTTVDDALAGDVAIGCDLEAEKIVELEPGRGPQTLEQPIAGPEHDEIDVPCGPRACEAELEGQPAFHDDVVAKVCDEPSHESPEHEPLPSPLKARARRASTKPALDRRSKRDRRP